MGYREYKCSCIITSVKCNTKKQEKSLSLSAVNEFRVKFEDKSYNIFVSRNEQSKQIETKALEIGHEFTVRNMSDESLIELFRNKMLVTVAINEKNEIIAWGLHK